MLNKKTILIIPSAAVILILLFLGIFNSIKLGHLNEALQNSQQLILDETAAGRETNDYLNNISSILALDISRTRASLGLDVTDYPLKSIDESGAPAEPEKFENNELFDAVTVLIKAEDDNKKAATIGRFFRNEIIASVIETNKIDVKKINNTEFEMLWDGQSFLTVSALSGNEIALNGISGDGLNINTASKETSFFINNNLEELKNFKRVKTEYLKNLYSIKDSEVAPSKDIKVLIENETLTVSNRFNSAGIKGSVETAGTSVSYRLIPPNEIFNDFSLFTAELKSQIELMDLRTEDEIMLDNAKSEFEKKLTDDKFKKYLEDMDFKVSTTPREDIDYFYYDIHKGDGTLLGAFSILKKVGEIYLVDADEVPVSSLKTMNIRKELINSDRTGMVIPENIPEFDSLYSNKDTVTFLLVGNHELNTDTMILVHANKKTGKAYLIGIPRDLYWKGRKINSIYLNYGPEQFKRELSTITGLDISNYIIVDMYAFIDIVNILGGIEVTLEEDLVDPTYKIRENGEWSTLNYAKGTYNMNGVESLRVARSRHGSNDFERSKRQQLIIESLLNRILELKITDVNKVYSMMQVIFEYIDTDFSLIEMMSLFNNYSDVELAGKHVLSFDNILYDTYSNIYMLEDQEDLDPDFNKGAWILFPRDNDWNNIRWYIRQIINGEI